MLRQSSPTPVGAQHRCAPSRQAPAFVQDSIFTSHESRVTSHVCALPTHPSPTMTDPTTPLMQQYHAIKSRYPHALLLFRLGDFYELFYEDALLASRELQITLTSRNREKGQPIPMCGVPYHAADGYVARLIRAGFKIAICDQMEQPGPGNKIVRREAVRVITPGTATDVAVLDARATTFLAAVARHSSGSPIGLAFVDLSTGEFQATEFAGP